MVMSNAEKARRAAKAAAAKNPDTAPEAAAAAPASATGPKIRPPATDSALGPKIRAPATKEKKDGVGDRTVVVVCKMPRGMYLQLHEIIDQQVNLSNGGTQIRKMPMRIGEQVRLKPAVLPFGAIPNYPIVDGFSLTRDVDANFWNQYYQQNSNLEMILSGLLCAFDNEIEATAYCREYGKLKHGLEPLAHQKDPRIGTSDSPNVTDIEIDTDSHKKVS